MAPHLAKPDALMCPKKFCFLWVEPGAAFAPGLYNSVEAGLASATTVEQGRCGCSFGTCARSDPTAANQDWYEPHEPHLAAAGLPWFFFIPDPYGLVGKARKRYILESEQLWGTRHWQQ